MRDQLVGLLARGADYLTHTPDERPLPDPDSVRRILVVKPCCLGDVLMATPILRALHDYFAEAEIDVLTTEWCAPALQTNPDVCRIYRYPDLVTPARFTILARRAGRRHYDIGIGLDRSPIVNLMLTLAGIPERAGIDNEGRGVGLTRRVNCEPKQHETELYLSVIGKIGVPPRGVEPEFRVEDDARIKADNLLPVGDRPLVVIHPGGAINPGSAMLSKRWPAIRYGELASILAKESGASIVVVGSESDRDAAQTTDDFTDAPVLNLSGQLSIQELGAVCERANLYVGNDSGMSHLASAVGAPTVTIFGPTNPSHYRPLGPNARVCAPPASWEITANWDLRQKQDLGPEVDITLVQVEEVAEQCRELLLHHARSSKQT